MFRLVWATDIHIDHADSNDKERFAREIIRYSPTAVMITGDIASGRTIEPKLNELHSKIKVPIYFNLGNHDFYGSSIKTVRKWAEDITGNADSDIRWIEAVGIVKLSSDTCLIGIDGWGDGMLGDGNGSRVLLNDWDYIFEFSKVNAIFDWGNRMQLLSKLGKEAADKLRPVLTEALQKYNRVLLGTHVPPWIEATWHEGKHSNKDWLPWFSCKQVGDVIVEEAKKHPTKQVTVLCGHTHGFGHSAINNQVDVYTGGATYRFPEVQCCFEIEDGAVTRLPGPWHNASYQ